MAAVWTTLLVLGVFVAVAQGLTCRQCPVGIFGKCLFPSEVVCDNATLNCFSGNAQFNATGSLRLHSRGCLDSDLCGRTLTGSILGAGFTSTFSCCQEDLCNGVTSAQLSRLLATAGGVTVLALLWAA